MNKKEAQKLLKEINEDYENKKLLFLNSFSGFKVDFLTKIVFYIKEYKNYYSIKHSVQNSFENKYIPFEYRDMIIILISKYVNGVKEAYKYTASPYGFQLFSLDILKEEIKHIKYEFEKFEKR